MPEGLKWLGPSIFDSDGVTTSWTTRWSSPTSKARGEALQKVRRLSYLNALKGVAISFASLRTYLAANAIAGKSSQA
jgi:hypothetical protein